MTWLLTLLVLACAVAVVIGLKVLSGSGSFLAPAAQVLLAIPLLPFWALMWLTAPIWEHHKCQSCGRRKVVLW